MGDLVATEHYLGLLHHQAVKYSLTRWQAWDRAYQSMLSIARGDTNNGLRLLRAGALGELGDRHSTLHLIVFEIAEVLGHAGKIIDALSAAKEAIGASELPAESWRTAELLRIKGELLLLRGAKAAEAVAEDHFRQALDWAHRQGALSWELRAATSIARLLRHQGRSVDAKALLQPVFARFTEGLDTTDLRTARQLVEELA